MKEYQAFVVKAMDEKDYQWLTNRLNLFAKDGFEVLDYQLTKDAGGLEWANVLMERDVPDYRTFGGQE